MIPDFLVAQDWLFWVLALVLGFPLLLILLGELSAKLKRRQPRLIGLIQIFRNFVLPSLALFILLVYVLQLRRGETLVRLTETFLWITVIYWGLTLINVILFEGAEEGSWQSNVPKLFLDLSRTFLVLVGTAIVLSTVWKADLGGLLTALGVGSLVIGLALQDSLGNVFSGLTLLFEQPVSIGDWIEIGGIEGKVVEITWRSVHVMTLERDLVIVPNSELAGASLKNYNRPDSVQGVVLEIGFSCDDPPNKVIDVLQQTALESDGVLPTPPPSAFIKEFGDFAITYKIRFFVQDYPSKLKGGNNFKARLWYTAKRNNLTMPYPISGEYEYKSLAPTVEDIKAKATGVLITVPGWDSLEENSLEEISEQAIVENFAKGEIIIKEGSQLLGLYVIIEGEVELSLGDRQIIGHLAQGEIFGEKASLLSGQLADVSVKAIQDVEVLRIDVKTLQHLLSDNPILASKLGEMMELRRKSLKNHLEKV